MSAKYNYFEAIDIDAGWVMTAHGAIYPITTYIDFEGSEYDHKPDVDIAAVVAGTGGEWHMCNVSFFKERMLQ